MSDIPSGCVVVNVRSVVVCIGRIPSSSERGPDETLLWMRGRDGRLAAESTAGRRDKASRVGDDTRTGTTTRADLTSSRRLMKLQGELQGTMTSSGHLYLRIGLDVHPIYWSDALALGGMVGELRNWLHRSICRLMLLRGETWVAQSQASRGRWRGQAQPRESGRERAETPGSVVGRSLNDATSRTEVGCRSEAAKNAQPVAQVQCYGIKQPRWLPQRAVGLTFLAFADLPTQYVSSLLSRIWATKKHG